MLTCGNKDKIIISTTPPEEHKRQAADANSMPRLHAGASSRRRGSRYFRHSAGVQVRLPRERTHVFSIHYLGFLVTALPFMKHL